MLVIWIDLVLLMPSAWLSLSLKYGSVCVLVFTSSLANNNKHTQVQNSSNIGKFGSKVQYNDWNVRKQFPNSIHAT